MITTADGASPISLARSFAPLKEHFNAGQEAYRVRGTAQRGRCVHLEVSRDGTVLAA